MKGETAEDQSQDALTLTGLSEEKERTKTTEKEYP